MSGKNHFIFEYNIRTNEMLHFAYSTVKKFEKDKIFIDTDELLLILDGVVLNRLELLAQSPETDWNSLIMQAYLKEPNQFFWQLTGSFWGFALNKITGEVVLFADSIGSKQVFFVHENDRFVVGTNSFELTDYLKKHSVLRPTLNEQAAYFIMAYGYVIEDVTIIEEIKRLMPGYYLRLKDKQIMVSEYYRLTKTPGKISDQDAIEEIDRLFRKSIQNSFEKDVEYGYQHLANLSAGLDSRMTTFVAHEMGYTDQTNVTFSQTNYWDEKVPKQMTSDLRHSWIFKSLDNGIFLKNIDDVTQLTGGNAAYFGVSHGHSLFAHFDFSRFGILHSGQFGNSIIGTFPDHSKLDHPFTLEELAPDATTKEHVRGYTFKNVYRDLEEYKNRNHCLTGGNNGLLTSQQKSESISPFYDTDFWTFCMTIPIEQRAYHRLYKLWVNQKYPKAAKYVWEQTKVPVSAKTVVKIKGVPYTREQLWNFAKSRTIHKFSPSRKMGWKTQNHMNPIDFWFATNDDLADFYHNYVREAMGSLDSYPNLKHYVDQLSKSASGRDRAKVLSLLGITKFLHS